MADRNQAKRIVRRTPSEKRVVKWVEQTKTLPGMLKY